MPNPNPPGVHPAAIAFTNPLPNGLPVSPLTTPSIAPLQRSGELDRLLPHPDREADALLPWGHRPEPSPAPLIRLAPPSRGPNPAPPDGGLVSGRLPRVLLH
eukprot:1698004-Pyramimonas_sp.AAC.1